MTKKIIRLLPFILALILSLGWGESYALKYSALGRIHQVDGPVDANDVNQKVLKIVLDVTAGTAENPFRNFMSFNLFGITELANAKLYANLTLGDSLFSNATWMQTIASPGASISFSGFNASNNGNGLWFYWLVVDSKATISNNVFIDAAYTGSSGSVSIPGFVNGITPINPNGFRLTGRYYTIGATENYINMKEVADGISRFDYDGTADVLMELTGNYSNSAEGQMIFRNHTGPANITIRPLTGQSGKITGGDPGTGAAVMRFIGAQKIVLDGRAGGIGTGQWVIRNTRTAATVGNTIDFSNEASNNKLIHLNIEGDASSTNAILFFSTTTGTNGNDNNTVSFCAIKDLVSGAGAYPCTGIYSAGTAAKTNSGNLIDNNTFVDIYNPTASLSCGIELDVNNDNWNITNNHFYQGAASYSALNTNPWAGIYINGGGGYVVTGNFIGGKGPNCSGTAFTVSDGNSQLQGIEFAAASGANCIVSGNTIANINYTSAPVTAGVFPILGIGLNGSVNYTCGSPGNGNTIGNMSVLNSITTANNSTTGAGFVGIYHNGSGTCTIEYNNFGGIKQSGSCIDAEVDLIYLNTNAGSVTITNNIFGSTLANSIEVTSNSILSAVYNAGNTAGLICSNNIFQNFSLSLSTGFKNLYGVLNAAGPFNFLNNTFNNFTSAHNAICNLVRHNGGTTANVEGNNFQNITLSNTGDTAILYGIYFNTTSAVTAKSNTFGNAAAGNILINGNGDNFIIYKTGGGSFSATNNIVQGITLTNGGATTGIEAILGSQGSFICTGNTIKNISVNTTSTSDYALIWSSTASAGVDISNNTIDNINYTNVGAFATHNLGIYVINGSGKITKNFIKQFSNSSTSPAAKIAGGVIFNGNWDIINNVILINNNGATNPCMINGIEAPSVNTVNLYHNTFKLFGSQSGNAVSACMNRTGAGAYTLKNNVFQNLRTGGTAGHYAEFAVSGGTYSTNYNYVEVADDQNKIGNFGGTNYNFTTWKSAPVNAANDLNGTTLLNGIGAAPAGFIGANAGFDLFTPSTVTDDKLNTTRPTTPWMGAYEGTFAVNTITTSSITPTTLCRGGSVSVTFTITGTYLAGNKFTAELSDEFGSFASPKAIGTVTATVATPISAVIPVAGTIPGTLYRIRVISSNPFILGTDNLTNLTVPADGGTGVWTWNGSTGTNWFDRCNWDKKSLPDASSDVVIPATGNNPLISGSIANCNRITINSSAGAILNLNSTSSGRLIITQ